MATKAELAELRELDLATCRTLAKELKPVGSEDPAAKWKALLTWLEADESRILPRTKEDVIAAKQDGYPEADELLQYLSQKAQ